MSFLVRILKLLLVLLVLAVVVLWFAAHRADRGYIEEQVTIDRPAPAVFRWITTDELLRRWISDLVKLERAGGSGTAQALNYSYVLEENIDGQRAVLSIRIIRAVPNQEIDLAISPTEQSSSRFISTANFKLYPSGDYTRVVFTAQTNFLDATDQIFEPILTIAMRRKLQEDLTRLKLMMEAEPAK